MNIANIKALKKLGLSDYDIEVLSAMNIPLSQEGATEIYRKTTGRAVGFQTMYFKLRGWYDNKIINKIGIGKKKMYILCPEFLLDDEENPELKKGGENEGSDN